MIPRSFPANPHPGRIYQIAAPAGYEYWRWSGKRWYHIHSDWDHAHQCWIKPDPISGLHLQLTGGGLWI